MTCPPDLDDYSPLLNEHIWARLRGQPPSGARPRLASSIVIVDRSGKKPTVLMGRRSASDRFMPQKYCFPGGRLDAEDRRMNVAGALASPLEDRLGKLNPGSPGLPRAIALAAIRETFEETGLLLGTREHGGPPEAPPLWRAFAEQGVYPDLEPLHLIARAITPPRLPKRYDTLFFSVDRSAVCGEVPGAVGPGRELVETAWVPLEDAQRLDVAMITNVVLRELEKRLAAGMPHWMPAPFYRVGPGGWRKESL